MLIIKAAGNAASDDPIIAWSGMSTTAPATPAAAIISPSTAPATGIITSYDSDGFTLPNSAFSNASGTQYYWTAIAGSGSELAIGNYTGDGADDRDAISGLAFQPTACFIRRRNLNSVFLNYRISSMTGDTTYQLGNASGLIGNMIQQFNPDGVQIGNAGGVNGTAAVFDWIAFTPPVGYGTMGSYVGNGTDNSDLVSGLTFQPEFLLIKGNTNQECVLRTTAHSGDTATLLLNSTNNLPNRIQQFNSDGAQLGNTVQVNSAAVTYHYMALRTTA